MKKKGRDVLHRKTQLTSCHMHHRMNSRLRLTCSIVRLSCSITVETFSKSSAYVGGAGVVDCNNSSCVCVCDRRQKEIEK